MHQEQKSGNMQMKRLKRNDCKNLVRLGNRKIGEVRYSESESTEHWKKKQQICSELSKQGKEFITEAIFKTGGRADILVLDEFLAIEIMKSEEDESIEKKKENYPDGIKIKKVRI